MACIIDWLFERFGESNGREQCKVGVFCFAALVAIRVTIYGQYTICVFGYNAATLVKAEHSGLVPISFGTVPDFWLIDTFGEIFPDNGRKFNTYADVNLIIAQSNVVLCAPAGEETASNTSYGKDNLSGFAGRISLFAVHQDFQSITIYIGNFCIGDDVAAGTKILDQAAHCLKVGIGSKMFELCLIHVQVVAQTKFFQLIVRRKTFCGCAKGNQNLVSLRDVINNCLRLEKFGQPSAVFGGDYVFSI